MALTCTHELEGAQNAGDACGFLAHCHARPLEHLCGIVQHRRLPSHLQQATVMFQQQLHLLICFWHTLVSYMRYMHLHSSHTLAVASHKQELMGRDVATEVMMFEDQDVVMHLLEEHEAHANQHGPGVLAVEQVEKSCSTMQSTLGNRRRHL